MTIPYNNGKVSIGSAYYLNPLRPKYVEQDTDMLLIQKYLIEDPSIAFRQDLITRCAELLSALVLIVVLVKGYF